MAIWPDQVDQKLSNTLQLYQPLADETWNDIYQKHVTN